MVLSTRCSLNGPGIFLRVKIPTFHVFLSTNTFPAHGVAVIFQEISVPHSGEK